MTYVVGMLATKLDTNLCIRFIILNLHKIYFHRRINLLKDTLFAGTRVVCFPENEASLAEVAAQCDQ